MEQDHCLVMGECLEILEDRPVLFLELAPQVLVLFSQKPELRPVPY